jgi:hypothetical protein
MQAWVSASAVRAVVKPQVLDNNFAEGPTADKAVDRAAGKAARKPAAEASRRTWSSWAAALRAAPESAKGLSTTADVC